MAECLLDAGTRADIMAAGTPDTAAMAGRIAEGRATLAAGTATLAAGPAMRAAGTAILMAGTAMRTEDMGMVMVTATDTVIGTGVTATDMVGATRVGAG